MTRSQRFRASLAITGPWRWLPLAYEARLPTVGTLAHRTTPMVMISLALLALLACDPEPQPTAAPSAGPTAKASSPAGSRTPQVRRPHSTKSSAAERQTLATAKIIVADLARSKNITTPTNFGLQLVDRRAIRTFVQGALYEQMTPKQIRLLGRVEASLGVIPLGTDGETLLLDMYEDGVLGIYDPRTKNILIGNFVDKTALGMVVGHEAAHGIQDMTFDLASLQVTHAGQSDRDSAKTFLIEGDAQATYLAWVAGDAGLQAIGDDVLRAQANMSLTMADSLTPYSILARLMQMPYTDGTATVIQLAKAEGRSAVDALFRHLPETTEQMLHLDKLRSREAAKTIIIDWQLLEDASSGHRVVWADDIGEAGLLAMLAEVEDPETARRGAAGWGGDGYIALDAKTPAEAPIVIGMIAWDKISDAREFETMFRRYLKQVTSGDYFLSRRGNKVAYGTRLAGAKIPLEAAVWKAISVAKPGVTGRRPPPSLGSRSPHS